MHCLCYTINNNGVFSVLTVPSNCTNGDVRLQNGFNAREGNVEVCVDGFWGTVCSNYWDSREATVVCKQLGFMNSGIVTQLGCTVQ